MVLILSKTIFFFLNLIFGPFEKELNFFFDFGELDIGVLVCIKKFESITPSIAGMDMP